MYTRQLKKLSSTRLDDVLLDEGAIDRARVEDAQAESQMTGRPLAHVLFERNEIDEWELAKMVARNYSLPFVDVVTYSTPREAEMLLDIAFCRRNLLLPFDVFGGIPAIAACEMPSTAVLTEIERRCGHLPFVYVTLRGRLQEELDSREAAGIVPATAADLPPPPAAAIESGSVQHDPLDSPSTSVLEELEPASMRLGFNMHMRGPGSPAPLPPALPPIPARSRPAVPPKGDLPPPFTTAAAASAADAPDAPADESVAQGEKPGKAAAWQSIFDLGDDATLGG